MSYRLARSSTGTARSWIRRRASSSRIQDAARDLGLPVPPRERARARHRPRPARCAAHRGAGPAGRALSRSSSSATASISSRAQDTMQLFAGMRGAACGSCAATATCSRSRPARAAAAWTARSSATGLKALFRASRCADETNPKPHPAMLLELMDELNVSKQRPLMIGDTSHDLEMARAAGVDALAVALRRARCGRACALASRSRALQA